jgi:hypothetical protein
VSRSHAIARIGSLIGWIGLAACSTPTAGTNTIAATGGPEGDPFDGTPAITRVELHTRDPKSGSETVQATISASSAGAADAGFPAQGGIDVPSSVTSLTGAIELALVGYDATGAALVYGRTPAFDVGALSQSGLTVGLLVQRLDRAARVMTLPATATRPLPFRLGVGYLGIADGATPDVTVVDLLQVTSGAQGPVLAAAPVAIASAGGFVLSIAADGTASEIDLNSGSTAAVSAPSGLSSFLDVAGGTVLIGDDATYLVGASRTSSPSAAILRLASDGTLSARSLLTARAGAAITYVSGVGVVAIGGSATGAGVEIATSSSSTALPYPADSTVGALAAPDATGVIRVTPAGAIEHFDVGCTDATKGCAPTQISAGFSAPSVSAASSDALFAIDGNQLAGVRGGAIVRIDPMRASYEVLTPAGSASRAALWADDGAVYVIDGGDTNLRSVRAR